jgi:thiamine-phosphate pyrophosphorylase
MPARDTGAERRARLDDARLYLVCPALSGAPGPGGRDLHDLLRAAADGGVDIVQLRDKDVDDRTLEPVIGPALELCRELGVLAIINDRPALALELGADGVHVGQDDMPVETVRELVGDDLLIGLSTHAPGEIDAVALRAREGEASGETRGETGSVALRAREGGASGETRGETGSIALRAREAMPVVDYIGVGPVHETPTKPGRPAVGQELVRYASTHAPVPFFAIGGLTARNLPDTLAAGARRVCVLRAISEAADPCAAARALRLMLDNLADPSRS